MAQTYDVDLEPWLAAQPLAEPALAPLLGLVGTRFDLTWLLAGASFALMWMVWANRYASVHLRWLPRSVYASRSAKVDYLCFLAFPVILSVLALAGLHPANEWEIGALVAQALDPSQPGDEIWWSTLAPDPKLGWLAFLGAAVVGDFVQWAVHLACHRYRWLWRWHRLHHSATVLTPCTGAREHPIIQLLDRGTYALAVGGFLGAFEALVPGTVTALVHFEGTFVVFALYWFAFLTNHYHVPVSFGPLEQIFVSPAYHRVHHLSDPAYHDRNFGHVLVVWDRLFATYCPAPAAGAAPSADCLGLPVRSDPSI